MKFVVFISYCDHDENSVSEFKIMLDPFLNDSEIFVWDKTQKKPGDNKKEKIKNALAEANIAVLFVSKEYIACNEIKEQEFLPILAAAKNGELKIFWILVSNCGYEETELNDYEPAHDKRHPLNSLSQERLDEVLKSICQKIREEVNEIHTDDKPSKTDEPVKDYDQTKLEVNEIHTEDKPIKTSEPEKETETEKAYHPTKQEDNEINKADTTPEPVKTYNLTQLEEYLKKKEWKEADKETTQLMLQVVKKVNKGYLSKKDIEKIDCDFLHEIDSLWVKYSEGNFGFTVQKEIWDGVDENCNGDYKKAEEEFGKKVGWCETLDEDRLECLRTNIQPPEQYLNKKKGYLPTPPPMTRDENEIQVWVIDAIAEKLKECKKTEELVDER